MRILFYSVLLLAAIQTTAQNTDQRLWDRQMKLKTGSIQITTDGFTATTFIELEFYNSHISEIEGLFKFHLKPEQIITAFQLDLNGKYRDGSIEEKWKATNTYNRIVGKRVDPALLTKEYDNNYNLRIYPVPAKQSRKVTITIQQVLKEKAGVLEYLLPFTVADTVEQFSVSVTAYNNIQPPQSSLGLIRNELFIYNKNNWTLVKHFSSVTLNKPVQFEWRIPDNPFYCTKKADGKNYFALRYQPAVDSIYQLHPSKIHVFWDASGTGHYRNTAKEISFLKQYLSVHNVKELTLITFNHEILDTLVFQPTGNSWLKLTEYLRNINYDGGTRLSRLNFSNINSDVIILFSDGKNSITSKIPAPAKIPVFCINTSAVSDSNQLIRIAGTSGGRYIALNKQSIARSIELASFAENYLIDIISSGQSIFESRLNAKLNQRLLVYGTGKAAVDTLTFVYGNNSAVSGKEEIIINHNNQCTSSAIDRVSMLSSYADITAGNNWNEILDFGLREKVVTVYTAYIVLERVQDYIQYNITPPKELEEECREKGFVKKDTRQIRKSLGKPSVDSLLKKTVTSYNTRIRMWSKDEPYITYSPMQIKQEISTIKDQVPAPVNNTESLNQLQDNAAGLMIVNSSHNLDEVVVVGYGVSSRKSLTYSVSTVQSRELFSAYGSIDQSLAGRVAGVSVSSNMGIPGAETSIRIRGASSILSNTQPLFVVDGMPLGENVNDIVNPNDIESISVLKGTAASAAYGSLAANGAIIITTKRGRFYRNNYNNRYSLKKMPDVDYLVEVKEQSGINKLNKYNELREQYKNDAGFYFDMADHLYASGFKKEAVHILMNASELHHNNFQLIRTIGFVLEGWKEFDKAVDIFSGLIEENPEHIYLYRDLAWTLYQKGEYQSAVDILYKAICTEPTNDDIETEKSILLNEMNSIIQIHKNKIDISHINSSLIKALPCDLRIVVEENTRVNMNVTINEPRLSSARMYNNSSRHGGYFTKPEGYYYGNSIAEYQLKTAVKGKYKIWVNYYNSYLYTGKIPSIIRVCIYKNFGKANQTIEVQNIMMDNQYGEIEISETNW
jgi:TonB-dependent SusC/RagA subfamily outer membrane receptor